MNTIIRYSGIAAISVSLIMLSLGSMPTVEAGVIPSLITLDITCGLTLTNADLTFVPGTVAGNALDTNVGADFAGPEPNVANPPGNFAQTQVSLSAGTDTGGGYVDDAVVTHIPPSQMQFEFEAGGANLLALSDANAQVVMGNLIPNTNADLHAVIDTTPTNVGTGITDSTWTATITVTGLCVI